MNIVLINHYAGFPEMGMEFRPYYMAKEWQKKGHKVYIIAGDYSHLRKGNPVITEDFQRENIDGIEYIWVKTGKYEGNGVKRAFTMFRFVSKLWCKAKYISQQFSPDIVIASSTYPLDTYAAQKICKYSNAKYIHEIHDMWPVSPMELSNMSKYHPFIIVMQMAENSFCKNADKIVSIPPATKEYLVEHGMKEEKFISITNGIRIDDWQEKKELPSEFQNLLDELKRKNKFIIGFFGSHTKSYALKYLIDAVRMLKRDDVCAILVGDGIEKENLIKYASDIKEKIYFLPVISKNCIPDLVEQCDCIYVGAMDSKMFRFGISMNKLFDAMMSGRPILYAVNAPNNYIEEYHCGISVSIEDAEALKNGIKTLVEMSEYDRQKVGENGRTAVVNHFEYKVLSEKFIKVMQELQENY